MNKSILGQTLDDYIIKQLDIRSQIYSSTDNEFIPSGNQPKGNLSYTLANTSFLRMSSGVNVETLEKARIFGSDAYMGNGLAKNFILQGGTLLNTDKGFQQRVGLESYKVGGTKDFGLRPMPGIRSVNITSKGRWGSLREASVSIKCFNRDQLSIIEALYLRPGYTVLLEWGNSLFYNNNFNLIKSVEFINFFDDNKSLESIHKEILAKRELYSGNYDGFIGPVCNFNIKHNSDGSYDCISKLITWGSIIESIKVNTTSNLPKASVYSNPPNMDELIYGGSQSPIIEVKLDPEKLDASKLEIILDTIYKTCNKDNITQQMINTLNNPANRVFISDIYYKYYDQDPLGHAIKSPAVGINATEMSTFTNVSFTAGSISNKGNTEEVINQGKNLYTYISLGSLLSIISKNCLIYTKNGNPIINIDFNLEENLCYSPKNQISIDPNICLIECGGNGLESLGLNVLRDNDILKALPKFKYEGDPLIGYTMNIMVNIQHAMDLLKSSEDKDKSVNLLDYLTNLMDNITIALGNIKEFNVGYDADTNTVIITDNQILESDISKTVAVIKTTGLKSTVRDMVIDSKINNNLVNVIAIGAQASGNTAEGIDTLAFQKYNEGLKDRFHPIKKDSDTPDTVTEEEYVRSLNNDERAKKIKDQIKEIYINKRIVQENVILSKNIYGEILNSLKVKSRNTTSIIPFTYSLKMNGLSGIKYGQLFSIEPNRLPKSYLNPENLNQPLVTFLITSIENSIENNNWVTTIGGQVAPIRNLKIK